MTEVATCKTGTNNTMHLPVQIHTPSLQTLFLHHTWTQQHRIAFTILRVLAHRLEIETEKWQKHKQNIKRSEKKI